MNANILSTTPLSGNFQVAIIQIKKFSFQELIMKIYVQIKPI